MRFPHRMPTRLNYESRESTGRFGILVLRSTIRKEMKRLRLLVLVLLTGAEVAGRATGAQSAPLTLNPLSPSAGRGGRTRKGGVLQPLLGLIHRTVD